MSNMQKPHALRIGDTIGLVGPSGAIRQENVLEKAIDKIKKLGFQVKLGESCGQVYGYLSGSDEMRARDLNAMFGDPDVDGIFCVKGGYGTARILDLLDYEVIAGNPKVFVGYSDITALHTVFHEKCNLVTFHGPMAASDAFDDFTLASLMTAITSTAPLGMIRNPASEHIVCNQSGVCEGILVGGNLSLVAAGMGTPYALKTKDKIIFLEDVGEKTYRLDGMLTQLRHAGAFQNCAGIVLGGFTDCPIEYPDFGLSLEDHIRDILIPCGKPIISNLQAGHLNTKITLPLGIRYRLDACNGTLEALEAAVL